MRNQTIDYPPWSRRALNEQLAVPLLILIYGLVSWAVARQHGVDSILSTDIYSSFLGRMLAAVFCMIAALYLTRIVVFVRPKELLHFIAADLHQHQKLKERLALGMPMLLALPIFFSLFSSMKMLIPYIHPYVWDADFERLDRWLHGGKAPWEWLQPFLGNAPATAFVNLVYNLWLIVMLTILVWQSFTAHRRVLRLQFLISYVLVWSLLGTLLAILLSSAGPCFYGRLSGHADVYAPLMQDLNAYSRTLPVWSLSVQDILWNIYTTKGADPSAGGGISAMPSVHVASSLLMTLLGWRTNRWLGVGLTVFLVVIVVGSVHLGWHYAVDGYVSLILVVPIWWISGFVARGLIKLPPTRISQ